MQKSSLLAHPNWAGIGGLVAVLGLIFTIYISLNGRQDKTEANERNPALFERGIDVPPTNHRDSIGATPTTDTPSSSDTIPTTESVATKTYEVTVHFPAAMSSAELLVDDRQPVVVERVLILARIRLTAGHHTIILRGERECKTSLFVGPETTSAYPCL